MDKTPSAISAFLDIKRNRTKKKQKLYKLAFDVSIDITTSIYSVAFLIMCGFLIYGMMIEYRHVFLEIEQFIASQYTLLLFILVMRSLVSSFTRPGVLFSSAELQLSLLPYSMKRLWMYCAYEKWIKSILTWTVFATILTIITPFHASTLFPVAIVMIVIQILTTTLQWKLFQVNTLNKFIVIFSVGFLYGLTRLVYAFMSLNNWYLVVTVLIPLVIVNMLLIKRLFKKIDWMKVVQTNDLVIWNIWFVNQMSKVEIKPPKRQGLLQAIVHRTRSKKPFTYNLSTMYARLWRRHFAQEKEQLIKVFGGIIILLAVLSFKGPWMFGIAITLSIFLFANIGSFFFSSMFIDRLVSSMPWDMEIWKQSFLRWAYGGGGVVLLLLSILLLARTGISLWIPVQLLSYLAIASYYLKHQMREKAYVISRVEYVNKLVESTLIIGMFILTAISIVYPYVSFITIACYFVLTRGKLWPAML
ncbi:hypothetical protein [Radiobacillus sp. PE A8.2]|uniref:hypothetical protein n=1 Tax=Radiobacillus sp. PE A8.2 TaxID=3380349 RepID=UPI00388D7559